MSSLSALTNKKHSNPEAILTIPSVVPNAVTQGRQAVTKTVATAMEMAATVLHPDVNYSPRCVLIAVRKLQYPSNPVRADQSIAAIAIVK
jgi:hypothetical protein